MSNVYYLENKGKVWYVGDIPWATSEEELAWFVAWELNKTDPGWAVMAFKRESLADDFEVVWQRDPRWINAKLGYANAAAGSTIGNYGCVLCSFTMVLSMVHDNQFFSPVDVNKRMVEVSGYSGDTRNLWTWAKAEEAYPEVSYDAWYVSVVRPAPVERMKEHLDAGGFLICQVDFKPVDTTVQSHYLTVLEISDDLKIGKAADPWTGRIVEIPPAYFNADWTPVDFGRAIMRSAFYSKA